MMPRIVSEELEVGRDNDEDTVTDLRVNSSTRQGLLRSHPNS